ncbi:hypothetical protein P4O66_001337 [Electrophorus voltai]|uniref:Uncharacterized protein n=1 Tax=Electrophorus voltai TaxID=2609070 RepID=A0AAD8ZAF3_9TELE|nr:hypothetical protein P4O66_001337 [Electrophorus voltai]
MDTLQFAYCHNHSTDNAIAHLLHTTLTHLDKGRDNWYIPTFGVIHCLQTEHRDCFLSGSVANVDAGKALSFIFENSGQTCTKHTKMPCRKENYIFLEQSVTVDSKEVDALVTKIGEALQLHNNSANQTMSCLHNLTNNGGHNAKQSNNSAGAQRRNGCCIRLRSRNLRSRASPYNIPGSSDQEWDHFKTCNRKGIDITGFAASHPAFVPIPVLAAPP